ncbi:phage tail protein [Microbacterium saperdae]|uniref:Tape measure domain-containing protein n=1 Tax=Microbacterium saperdae TaxID=69368 RepID=A0A543BQU7_9MICO|nr:tape measure protein [Microbacterium saperdae]TQL87206.1 tape measure domain-containing protein [Microbacterium saperdae]GGM42104.1 hypothetical protein GCM10010489_11440 [Microbacterium saperdae]
MSQVAVAEVPVVPVLKGLRRGIRNEAELAEKDASGVLRRGLTRSATESGAAAGRGLRRAFTASAGTLTGQLTKQMTVDVAKAAQAVGASRIREADAAGAVRVAEAQLAEARSKYAAGSSQVVRAEERVAATQRRLETQADATRSALDRLNAAQLRLADATALADSAVRGGGFSEFRRNVADLLAPVTALTRGVVGLASRALSPLVSRLQTVGRSIGSNVAGAFGRATAGIRDFGTQIAYRVVSPLAAAENFVRARFGPQLAAIGRIAAPIGRSFQGAFGLATQALRGAGGMVSQVGSGIASAFSSAMSAVRRTASDAATAVSSTFKTAGVAVAAALGASLVGGFSRLSGLETAQARMAGLGLSAEETARAMDIANKSATDTAFSLDEMASAAALALTGGVAESDLAGYLDTIKNTATASGAPLQEIASIFGKVQTAGRAYSTEINQLADRQIPIWKALQDEMGTTAEETRKAVEAGKVDLGTYQRAVDSAVGGMADDMGGTTTSIIRNTRTALSRFGAALLGGVYPIIGPLFTTIRKGIDAATAAVKPLFDALGGKLQGTVLPALERLNTVFDRIKQSFSGGMTLDLGGVTGSLAVLAPIIGALVGSLGPLLARLPLLSGLFAGTTAPVGLLAGALFALFAVNPDTLLAGFESLVPAIGGIVEKLLSSLTGLLANVVPGMIATLAENAPMLVTGVVNVILTLVNAIVGAAPGLLGAVVGIIPALISALLGMLPQIMNAGLRLFTGLIDALVTVVTMIVNSLVTLLPQVITAIVEMLPRLIESGISLFLGLVTALVEAIPKVITALVAALPQILTALVNAIPLLIEAGINLFMSLIQALTTVLPQLITSLIGMLPTIITALVSMIPTLLLAAVDLFIQLVQAIPVVLPQLITSIVGMIPTIISSLLGMIPVLIEGAVQLFLALVQAIPQIIPPLIEALFSLGPEIVGAILAIVPELVDAGAALIQGLIDGVMSMFGSIGNAFGDVMDFIGGFFPHSPAKRGPFSGSGWRRVAAGGEALVEQFAAGANGARAALQLDQAVQLASASVGVSGAPGGGSGAGAGVATSGPQVSQVNHYDKTDPREAAELATQQLAAIVRSV